ncbi:restriction endonuclease subunit S [Acidicapsa ligni]|uniref:restriction endonuclease subunit S n=1 Tax=Acidicapsa ligni TaxID=542300 RepID=UPI0021E0E259|nr:restriction endonuclease subunit S [Acidicapsa ligni]
MKERYPLTSIGTLESVGAILGIQDGNHGERHPKVADYVEDGIAFVMANNLSTGVIDYDGCSRISEDQASRLRIGFSMAGDVLLTHKGTLGSVALVTEASPYIMLTPQVTYYRTDESKLLNRFLVYAFRDPRFQARLHAVGGQGTRPYIGVTAQRKLEIVNPPRDIQERIANVLSPYDELIDNNRRRMLLLEKTAKQIYQEWFVRLRFPGYEHTDRRNGVPNGWERVPAPSAVYVNPRTSLPEKEEHAFVEMSDLPVNSMVIQQTTKREGRSGSKFQNGDTLFARITPCLENGKTGFVDFLEEGEVGRGSTEFIVLRSRRLTPEFVYCMARSYDFRENAIKSMIGASGRQRVQETCFDKFFVFVPTDVLLRLFTDSVRPMFNQIRALRIINQRLRFSRDILTPKLMTGEIVA